MTMTLSGDGTITGLVAGGLPNATVTADDLAAGAALNSVSDGVFFRNRIINGDMRIDQRNAGASVTQTTAAVYSVDRFFTFGSVASKFSIQQNAGSVTPPAGFTNYLGVTSLSAYSPASGTEQYVVAHYIEGFNMADLAWGTSDAKNVIISFWVRSSLTGTFGGALRNTNNTRSYPFEYTISSADTWEYKTVTISGDTAGTWLTDSGTGIKLTFGMGAGATISGTAGAWANNTSYVTATGATSVVGTNGATWYITGVQLEIGSVATPFERRPYGTELSLCQRYYEKYSLGANTVICVAQCYSTSAAFGGPIKYTVTKRATPTITLPVAGTGTNEAALSSASGSFPGTIGTHSISGATVDMARVNATGYTSAFTAGDASCYISTNSGTAVIEISAEL